MVLHRPTRRMAWALLLCACLSLPSLTAALGAAAPTGSLLEIRTLSDAGTGTVHGRP